MPECLSKKQPSSSTVPDMEPKKRRPSSAGPDMETKKRRPSSPVPDIEKQLLPPTEAPTPEAQQGPPPELALVTDAKAILAKLVQAAGDPNGVASSGSVDPSMDMWRTAAYCDVKAPFADPAVPLVTKHMVLAGLIAAAHSAAARSL